MLNGDFLCTTITSAACSIFGAGVLYNCSTLGELERVWRGVYLCIHEVCNKGDGFSLRVVDSVVYHSTFAAPSHGYAAPQGASNFQHEDASGSSRRVVNFPWQCLELSQLILCKFGPLCIG